MQSTVQSHIAFLTDRIEGFKAQLAEPGRTPAERDSIKSSLHIAEMALTYYCKAYELEQEIRLKESAIPS
jgi:hypothetical protein